MKALFFSIAVFIASQNQAIAQERTKQSKISFSVGYGLAGSFSVRSYSEVPPFPTNTQREFNKKNFIGNALNGAIGFHLKQNYELQAGFHYQDFTRHAQATDTLSNVVVSINTTIRDRNYIYFANVCRKFEKKHHIFSPCFGLYILDLRQEGIEYGFGVPTYVNVHESQKGDLGEAGVFAEIRYEYMFQPKVNVGLKSQIYYTATASYFESVALFPFIKLNF